MYNILPLRKRHNKVYFLSTLHTIETPITQEDLSNHITDLGYIDVHKVMQYAVNAK